MTMNELYTIIVEHGSLTVAIVFILMTFIQIVPIKINPWTALVKWLGKNLTEDLTEKVDKVDKKLDKHIAESDERDLRKRRESILDFASAISNGRNYTKEQYEQMLKECDEYTMYCHEKNFINSVADGSIATIKASYTQRLRDNSFLTTIILAEA